MGLKAIDINEWHIALEAKVQGDTNVCKCPAHADEAPSFAFKEDEGSIFGISFKCFAGCEGADLIQSLKEKGLLVNDGEQASGKAYCPVPPAFKEFQYVTHYTYKDVSGEILMYVGRYEADGKKQVIPYAVKPKKEGQWWRAGLGEFKNSLRPLYNLPKVANTLEIWIVEGEKTVDALGKLGMVATCCVGGSGAAGKADWTILCGKSVIIWADKDDSGQKYQKDVIKVLQKLSVSFRIVNTAKVEL